MLKSNQLYLAGLCLCALTLQAGAETGAACDAMAGQACSAAGAPAASPAPQAAGGSLAVSESGLGTGVENRALVGGAEAFPAGTEKLYCLTKVTGGKEGDTLVHKWSHNGTVVAEISLKVGGSPWRTYSNKTLGADASGAWSVDVIQNGAVLKHLETTVAK